MNARLGLRRGEKHKNHTLRTIVVSYCCVLILPVLFGAMLYGDAIRIVAKENEQAQAQLLYHVAENVNISIESVNNVVDSLLSSSDVTYLAKLSTFGTDDYWRMNSIQKQTSFATSSNNYVDDILLYFHESDSVLGSKLFFNAVNATDATLDLLAMSVAEFKQQLAQNNTLRFFITDNVKSMPFLIRSNAHLTLNGSPTVTVLIRFSKNSLNRLLSAQDAETFLFDGQDHYLATYGARQIGNAEDVLEAAKKGEDEYFGYSMIHHPQASLAMRYIRLMPVSVYAKDVAHVRTLLMVYVFLCLVIGIPLSAYMVRRSYSPIKQIVSILPTVASDQDADDFARIERSVAELIEQNISNESKIDKQKSAMQSHLMHRIIQGRENNEKEFIEGLKEFGIVFPYMGYLMLAVDVEDGSSLFFENAQSVNTEMLRLAFFAVSNKLKELLGSEYVSFIAEYDDLLLAVVNIDERLDKEYVLKEIKTSSHELISRMKNDFRADISVSVSGIYSGWGGIGQCYLEIMEIMRIRDTEKEPPLLLYRDIRIDEEATGLEKKAIQAIREHDWAQARMLLKEAINESAAEEETDVPKGIEAVAAEDLNSIEAILSYIDEHYMEQDLSVAAIAEKFDMRPPAFSLFFKRRMGTSPLDYINLKRIENVKQLLQGDLPIKTIAYDVGYYDTHPMIRFFKRSVGMTPTEYREQLRNAKMD